jgi:hypothetical protein
MTMWDRNPNYKGRNCLVCGERAHGLVAPVGIASGSFPCHPTHDDREIMLAYFAWCETGKYVQPRLIEP